MDKNALIDRIAMRLPKLDSFTWTIINETLDTLHALRYGEVVHSRLAESLCEICDAYMSQIEPSMSVTEALENKSNMNIAVQTHLAVFLMTQRRLSNHKKKRNQK